MVAFGPGPCLCDGWVTNIEHPNPKCPYYRDARMAERKAKEFAKEQRRLRAELRQDSMERFRRRGRG